jgi:hypothetical protein
MIIQLDSATTENTGAARHSLEELARSWGHQIDETPAEATPAARAGHDDGKAIDPVAVASLVLSIPSAALAVADLADRIRKRRRAADLIDHARQLAARQVTIYLISPGHTTDMSTLTPISSWTSPTKTRTADPASPMRQSGLRISELAQLKPEETIGISGYSWVKHPAITGRSVHHVKAVSSRAIPSHHRAAPGSRRAARFTTAPRNAKALPG